MFLPTAKYEAMTADLVKLKEIEAMLQACPPQRLPHPPRCSSERGRGWRGGNGKAVPCPHYRAVPLYGIYRVPHAGVAWPSRRGRQSSVCADATLPA